METRHAPSLRPRAPVSEDEEEDEETDSEPEDDESGVSRKGEAVRLSLGKHGVEVDPPRSRRQDANAIRTTRFTPVTWLPKSLYLQFHRVANIYFVLVAILACTPWWGGKWSSKVITVLSILLIQALKDGYEDLKRHWDDQEINSRKVKRYDPKERAFRSVEWQSCEVGDLLLIEKGAQLPCDLLVAASAESSGVFFLSTKSLDGETNLKERQVPPPLLDALSGADAASAEDRARGLLASGLVVDLEPPSPSLLDMDCSISIGGRPCGVHIGNFALRGCELQNTGWALGVAAYLGNETKVRLNSSEPPSKTSELERFLNKCVMCILAFIFSVALGFGVASTILHHPAGNEVVETLKIFVKYVVILYAVLPMTLYIAFEILHLIIGFQIEVDPLMTADGIPAKARNTSVVEELGQVDFVFSDKTGTLTANEMRFAYCCIGDTIAGPFLPSESGGPPDGFKAAAQMLQGGAGAAKAAADFFEALAVCHTVKLEEDGGYQGESPDEVALVEAARSVGFALVRRRAAEAGVVHTVQGPDGTKDHLVGHLLAFNSDRKRMSVVCPLPEGGAVVITKGADNVMEGLLADSLPSTARWSLVDFARRGLRTLIVARRVMDSGTYASWKRKWDEACAAMDGRAERIAAVSAEAEVGLTFCGITALEDRLQDGVPETVATLREAGIRVWVLTGDKVETAVEIAKSCQLFEDGMKIARSVGAVSPEDAIERLSEGSYTRASSAMRGMVLDGLSVSHVLSSQSAQKALYELAESSSACVCCRLSPMQKRELVELVCRQNSRAITLSIGDGANDVPMIQGAHIGVGIRGKEGSAAVQACDMAVSQFRFLGNLVFCHGRKAYRRIAVFLCFFIYKSVVLGWSYILYAYGVRFLGRSSFPEWLDILYNPLTSAAAVILLALDCDHSDKDALRSPWLYSPGPDREYLNGRVFLKWMCLASFHGILAWALPVRVLASSLDDRLEQTPDFWQASYAAFTIVFLVTHLKLLIATEQSKTGIGVGVVVLEMLVFVPITAFLGTPLAKALSPELSTPYNVVWKVLTTWRSGLLILLVPCAAVLPDLLEAAARVYRRRRRRKQLQQLRQAESPAFSEDSSEASSSE